MEYLPTKDQVWGDATGISAYGAKSITFRRVRA